MTTWEVTTHYVDKSAGGRSQPVSVVQDVTSRHCALKLCRVQAFNLNTKGRAIIKFHRADEKNESFSNNFLADTQTSSNFHRLSRLLLKSLWSENEEKFFLQKHQSAVESRTKLLYSRWKHNFSFKRYFGFYLEWSGAIASFTWTFLRCFYKLLMRWLKSYQYLCWQVEEHWLDFCNCSGGCGRKVQLKFDDKQVWQNTWKSLLELELNFSVHLITYWTPVTTHTKLQSWVSDTLISTLMAAATFKPQVK